MQKYEMERKHGIKKRFLKDMRQEKINQAEIAISNGNFKEVFALLDDISSICRDLGEKDLSIEFSKYSSMLKEQGGLNDQEIIVDTSSQEKMEKTNEKLDEEMKMRKWLVELQSRAQAAYIQQDYQKAKFFISQMLVIAKKLGQKDVIKNYKQNLKKIDDTLKKS